LRHSKTWIVQMSYTASVESLNNVYFGWCVHAGCNNCHNKAAFVRDVIIMNPMLVRLSILLEVDIDFQWPPWRFPIQPDGVPKPKLVDL
jgi:hypothetical protein